VDAATWSVALLGALSMLGALAIMVPVTWVYMVTRSRRGYNESVVHTLLILPVAVTGIVMIVHDSVALAFSLAGIVAAVRFRTTLEDTKDAVYVFLAIGVGLASGVHALGLALVLSLVFNAVILVLWRTNLRAVAGGRGRWASVTCSPVRLRPTRRSSWATRRCWTPPPRASWPGQPSAPSGWSVISPRSARRRRASAPTP
jgi:hypothetical protein